MHTRRCTFQERDYSVRAHRPMWGPGDCSELASTFWISLNPLDP